MRRWVAVIPGDGIGTEVIPVAVQVLDEALRVEGATIEWEWLDWRCDHYVTHGRMMPGDGLDVLARHHAILLGAAKRWAEASAGERMSDVMQATMPPPAAKVSVAPPPRQGLPVAIASLLGATLFWASNHVMGSEWVETIDPLGLLLLRWAIALVPLAVIAPASRTTRPNSAGAWSSGSHSRTRAVTTL